MPQSRSIHGATEHSPNGPGSVYSNLVEVSWSMRRRAIKVNDTEKIKLERRLRQIERNARADRIIRNRLIAKVDRKLQERRALQRVLTEGFRANEFNSLNLSDRCKDDFVADKQYSYETKIYHGGFTQKNLQPEIDRQLREWDPSNVVKKQREGRIKELKSKNAVFVIDRRSSFNSIMKDHQQHVERGKRAQTDPDVKVKDKYDIFADLDTGSLGSDEDNVGFHSKTTQRVVLPDIRHTDSKTGTLTIEDIKEEIESSEIQKTILPPIGKGHFHSMVESNAGVSKENVANFKDAEANAESVPYDRLLLRTKKCADDKLGISGNSEGMKGTIKENSTNKTLPFTITTVSRDINGPAPEEKSGHPRDKEVRSEYPSDKKASEPSRDEEAKAKKPAVITAKPLHRQASNLALHALKEA